MSIDSGPGSVGTQRPFGLRIDASGLSVQYQTGAGPVRALDDVTLTIDPGRSTAIVGTSGSGKSTLLGLLGGLELPTAGEVLVGEHVVSAMSDQRRASLRRQCFGFVFQADTLQPFLTVSENLGLQAVLAGHTDEPTHRQELLDALDVGDLGHRFPDQLSGGQRQRVAVARALVHSPSVVLADEPTGALDTANSDRVVELLLRLQRADGATLVVVTHDRAVAERMDTVVELRAGQVIETNEAS